MALLLNDKTIIAKQNTKCKNAHTQTRRQTSREGRPEWGRVEEQYGRKEQGCDGRWEDGVLDEFDVSHCC